MEEAVKLIARLPAHVEGKSNLPDEIVQPEAVLQKGEIRILRIDLGIGEFSS